MDGHLEKLRRVEIDAVKVWLRPGMHVLEIGGGNGYQASILTAWGYQVVSIDLPNRPPSQRSYHQVLDYDGRNIPFANFSFDLVFSSNVLEHIPQLPVVLKEIHRVLKPGSVAVHIVPSSAWRLWTSLAYYIFLLKYLLGARPSIPWAAHVPTTQQIIAKRGLGYLIKRALFSGPHGEYPSALAELYYFSRARWRRLFKRNGFDVIKATGTSLFYTGYGIFSGLSLPTRRRLARFMGSACHVFVMRAGPAAEKS